MNYKEYIELGFTRHDLDDSVEMDCSGYGGYYLNYKLDEKTSIGVYWNKLKNPRLFIKKNNSDFHHSIEIDIKQVFDILNIK